MERDRIRMLNREVPTAAVAVAVALAVMLSGCRGDEQNRPVTLEKGSYQGQKDTALSEEQRRELRERSQLGH